MVQKKFFENLPALNLNNYPIYKITNIINKYIIDTDPEVILIPSSNDIHDDHKIIFRAAKVSLRFNKKKLKRSYLMRFFRKQNGMKMRNHLIQIILLL